MSEGLFYENTLAKIPTNHEVRSSSLSLSAALDAGRHLTPLATRRLAAPLPSHAATSAVLPPHRAAAFLFLSRVAATSLLLPRVSTSSRVQDLTFPHSDSPICSGAARSAVVAANRSYEIDNPFANAAVSSLAAGETHTDVVLCFGQSGVGALGQSDLYSHGLAVGDSHACGLEGPTHTAVEAAVVGAEDGELPLSEQNTHLPRAEAAGHRSGLLLLLHMEQLMKAHPGTLRSS